MSSKKELEIELDKIPADYPYKYIANLREMHLRLHRASRVNLAVPYSPNNLDDLSELRNLKPTDVQIAFELEKQISSADVFKEGSKKVLELVQQIYSNHYPTEKIDHAY